ncbi:RusA family crossover junction endodeoxyribonuclease [bacterium]|nr:MAG: RusA family crossover junction endodeoxyribonuclease [bacterium]
MAYIHLDIKPLSVNDAWQGRRYKTDAYRKFEKSMLFLLPKRTIPKDKKLKVQIEYGFSSKASDIDNPCKMLLDVLQKKYGFNDSQIYELIQHKEIVKKGEEFININVTEY